MKRFLFSLTFFLALVGYSNATTNVYLVNDPIGFLDYYYPEPESGYHSYSKKFINSLGEKIDDFNLDCEYVQYTYFNSNGQQIAQKKHSIEWSWSDQDIDGNEYNPYPIEIEYNPNLNCYGEPFNIYGKDLEERLGKKVISTIGPDPRSYGWLTVKHHLFGYKLGSDVFANDYDNTSDYYYQEDFDKKYTEYYHYAYNLVRVTDPSATTGHYNIILEDDQLSGIGVSDDLKTLKLYPIWYKEGSEWYHTYAIIGNDLNYGLEYALYMKNGSPLKTPRNNHDIKEGNVTLLKDDKLLITYYDNYGNPASSYYPYSSGEDKAYIVEVHGVSNESNEIPLYKNGCGWIEADHPGIYKLTLKSDYSSLTMKLLHRINTFTIVEIVNNGVDGECYNISDSLIVADIVSSEGIAFLTDGKGNWITLTNSPFSNYSKGYAIIGLTGFLNNVELNPYLTYNDYQYSDYEVHDYDIESISLTDNVSLKSNQIVNVTGYWNESEGVLQASRNGNQGQSMVIDTSWANNGTTLKDGQFYTMRVAISLKETSSLITASGANNYIGHMLEASETSDPTTGVENIASRAIKNVRYYNVAGLESATPFKGINIVVTEMNDGTKRTEKLIY